MGRTIVQEYGPIYGEPVNGTVQGRPNGSRYVPISNTISFDFVSDDTPKLRRFSNGSINLVPQANVVAVAQDLASNIKVAVYTDEECTTLYCSRNFRAGVFNYGPFQWVGSLDDAPETGVSYYFRCELWNNGTQIAVSEAVEVVGY